MAVKVTKETFVIKAKQIHGNKYDYSKVNYVNQTTKVRIICNKCGTEFWQTPNNHTNKTKPQGCPNCKYIKIISENAKRAKNASETFVIKAKQIHGNKYDYSKVNYINAHTKICIICNKCGFEFWQTPNNHINNHHPQGCPNCMCQSVGEQKIKEFLDYKSINYIHDKSCLEWLINPKTSYKLRPDFYLPDYNLVIEYDGRQHFKSDKNTGWGDSFEKVKERDLLKEKLCREHNVDIIRLSEYSKIEKILEEKLL